jgi:hypothetical protein
VQGGLEGVQNNYHSGHAFEGTPKPPEPKPPEPEAPHGPKEPPKENVHVPKEKLPPTPQEINEIKGFQGNKSFINPKTGEQVIYNSEKNAMVIIDSKSAIRVEEARIGISNARPVQGCPQPCCA